MNNPDERLIADARLAVECMEETSIFPTGKSILSELADRLEELKAELSAKDFALRSGKSLAEDSLHAIREMLREQNVPEASFIDDHVANAIIQRDNQYEENASLIKRIAVLEELLTNSRAIFAKELSAGHNYPGPTIEEITEIFWDIDGVLEHHDT